MSFNFQKFKKVEFRKGMTYVELIVVLSIFSIMSAISLFDYRKFEAKVEVKNLANDIALQIVNAQKSAMAGKIPEGLITTSSWVPAHGVYFDLTEPNRFIAFADVGSDNIYGGDYENESVIEITKQSFIKGIKVEGGYCFGSEINDVSIVFRRPDSSALVSNSLIGNCSGFSFVDIYVSSADNSATANIKIYPTGRIEID